MTADRQAFQTSFCYLTGHSPMPWQGRLFEEFVRGGIPAALDLPTGLGKTSVMAIWLIARALAEKEALKAIPRRLVYIVDRRAVVDQASEEAKKLLEALNGAAVCLKEPLGLGDGTIPVLTWRGAHPGHRKWLDDPAAPAIIVGTVDMIGSRLLFEGYGVSRKMRPYHAGFLGVDTLVVLDEAHLVPPFEALLRRIANGMGEFGAGQDDDAKLIPPFKLLSLSATGREKPASDAVDMTGVFQLDAVDLCDPTVRKRLGAKKTLDLMEISDEKDALVNELAARAWALSENRANPIRCLVYCNSRAVAEKVKEKLDKSAAPDKKGADPKADTELFVGARRIRERERAKAWLQDHGFLAGSSPPTKPAFLIATSAGEVGVDLDADHMVCDLVPWERMVQRLGRVNRRGLGDATVTVVHGDEPKPKKPGAPTEKEIHEVIGFRSLAVLEKLPDIEGGKDASPGALRALKLRAECDPALQKKIDAATTPEPLRPALTRALVDAWSMTSLEQHPGRPEVAPWLRGWVEEEPQTTIVWRTFLPVRKDDSGRPSIPAKKKEVEAFFEAAPLQESEKLETETWRVAAWLQARAEKLRKHKTSVSEDAAEESSTDTSDTEADEAGQTEANPATSPAEPLHDGETAALLLSPDGGYVRRFTLGELAEPRSGNLVKDFNRELAGKIIILDARFHGMKDGMLDQAAGDDFETADACDAWSQEAEFRVRCAGSKDDESKDDDWRFEDDFVLRRDVNGDPEAWLVVEHFKDAAQSEDARSISRPQALAEHQCWAERKAREIAGKIGLPESATEALAVAAFLHDEGKKASRWQRAFRASRDANACGLSGPLAKTRGPIDQKTLNHYRHEFGSLPHAEAHERFKTLPEDWRDLVLHLIAAHHGNARPVITTSGCEDAPPSALQDRAQGVALRFARLQKRWGPWGLAWWEALLRAADGQASSDNDKRMELGPSSGEGK